ncbi:MAG TPA: lysozyme inhibitor LprI family protein, partial [Chloroflexota bacterium]|nr:lysozyme inhibitor LprI family protein [Chloroflexota bacterium]
MTIPFGDSGRSAWPSRAWALLTLVLLSAMPARRGAQEFHENVRHPCQDFWMLTRAEILACLRADYAAADAELNRVYQQKMASRDEAGRQTLRESQRAWLARYD